MRFNRPFVFFNFRTPQHFFASLRSANCLTRKKTQAKPLIYRQCRKKRYWMHLSDEHINGVHLSYFRQVVHVYYQLFDSKMADGDQLWSVPKLEYDLLRRNASTNGQKTDLMERYILHRKPKQTIYVRYFSILLYLLNVQVASTVNKENKTSL